MRWFVLGLAALLGVLMMSRQHPLGNPMPSDGELACYWSRDPALRNQYQMDFGLFKQAWQQNPGWRAGVTFKCPRTAISTDAEARCYIAKYPQLGLSSTTQAREHFRTQGSREGRSAACPLTDTQARNYMQTFPELRLASVEAARAHWEQTGWREGFAEMPDAALPPPPPPKPLPNPKLHDGKIVPMDHEKACIMKDDLVQKAFGGNQQAFQNKMEEMGFEGVVQRIRCPRGKELSDKDAKCYLNRYEDVKKLTYNGRFLGPAKDHFADHGFGEGRSPACELTDDEAQYYINTYDDLGNLTLEQGKRHWVEKGWLEGRMDPTDRRYIPSPGFPWLAVTAGLGAALLAVAGVRAARNKAWNAKKFM